MKILEHRLSQWDESGNLKKLQQLLCSCVLLLLATLLVSR
jgi:hypothetical protein